MKRIGLRILTSAVVLATCGAFGVALAGNASASESQCPRGYGCIWVNSNYNGYLWGSPNKTNLPSVDNDRNDSTYDNTAGHNNTSWWANGGWNGYNNCNFPQVGTPDDHALKTGLFSTFQNTISSLSWFPHGEGDFCSSYN